MKTASVRDLRNHHTTLLRWIKAGEEVLITRRGIVIARLTPESPKTTAVVNWADSPEVRRNRSAEPMLTATESASLIAEAGEKW